MGPRSYREYVEAMVKNLRLGSNVRFLGYVEQDRLSLLYNAADLTVVPSYSEGAPLVIPESLACGTPVIATNVGGNPEYLSLAGLEKYIVDVINYDFSRNLTKAICLALQESRRVLTENVLSWYAVARSYLNIMTKLMM
ncbi:MAG: glycosyltransferase, partial [Infirmifilum sp.]